ncbi:MAG TPA: MarR family transcriptional regulator [Stellaceae bacterium]|nr:MarR family transcriptional regulator [Stellaceae bacterium]
MADGTGPVPKLADQLCFAVYSTTHALIRVYKPLLTALGLTYSQYLVMMTLWQEDGLAVKQIGELLHLDSGTLTPLLKRLEAAGQVRRERDPTDERQVRIRLTATGHALRDKARSIPQDMLCASGRSADEVRRLKEDLVRLRDQLNSAVP